MEEVRAVAERVLGSVLLLHSTSWRRDKTGVVLSFFAVVEPEVVAIYESRPVMRADLARGEAASSPRAIAADQVLEHALRHLAWLSKDDPVVSSTLTAEWKAALDGYVPEPFRALS